MAFQPESPVYDAGVLQLETTTPVQGGVGGASNSPLLSLANRTAYLKQHVDALEATATTLAPINSPAFTGTPTAPDVALGDRSSKIANTKFVQDTVNSVTTKDVSGGVNVTLTAVEAGAGVLKLIGVITANISVIVPNTARKWVISNQTTGAFTLTVKTASGAGVVVTQGRDTQVWCDATDVRDAKTDFTSPAMTGTPTVPTPAAGDDSTKAASTAFARSMVGGFTTVSVAGGSNVTLTQAQADTGIITLTGALTANINLIYPTKSGRTIIRNNSSGAFDITCKTAAGTGAILPQGLAAVVICDGTNVYLASSSGQSSLRYQEFAPAAGTTVLTVTGGYTPGNIQVEKNGALLHPFEYTATNGTSITVAATTAGDKFTVYAFSSFSVANAVQKSGDTMTGALVLAANSTAPTAAAGDNSTKVASTAFVLAEILNEFTKAGQRSLGASGYQKLPGGLMVQWGETTFGAATGNVTFPIAFPNAATFFIAADGGSTATFQGTAGSLSTTGATTVTFASAPSTFYWFALGY